MSKKKVFKLSSILVIVFTIVALFINFKYHTQDKFWISYFGESQNSTVIKVDSFRLQKRGYGYYHTLTIIDTSSQSQKHIELISGTTKYELGAKIKVKILKDKAAFSETPSFIFSLILGGFILFSWILNYTLFFKK
ncbi:hypothetical protein [Cellulophaga sp. Ld12]|uniref:hypothetical protein n=1 Tax=Cellulophaga sp. Ld12 TaxID=3229535 RepID=UPI003862F0BE